MNKYFVEVVSLCVMLSFVVSTTSSQFDGRIINGEIADEAHDFAVRIVCALSANSPSGFLSTGVAVTPNHVITVGQAIHGFGIWYIGHGSIHVADQYESISIDATPHPEYDANFLHNNIGVIRVRENISTIIEIITPTATSFNFGYGVITNHNQELAGTLKQSSNLSHPSDNTMCLYFFNVIVMRPDNICSFVIESAISNGDQGGPVTNHDVSGVYGIASFWDPEGKILVLVNLNTHIDFILAQLNVPETQLIK